MRVWTAGRRPTTPWAVGIAAITALGAGACAQKADGPAAVPDVVTDLDVGEFAATSEYLTGIAEATDGQTYRVAFDMTMRFSGEGESVEMGGPLMTGEVDGDMSAMTMDLGAMFDDLANQLPAGEAPPDELLGSDLTMEMVTDASTLYLRAPYFASLADMAGGAANDLGPLGDLAELDDQWGRIDMSRVSPSQVASAAGSQSADPQAYLDIVAQGDDVQDLGTDAIDGAEVRGLGATITYGDMVSAQGLDPDDIRGQLPLPDGDEAFDDVADAMLAMEVPVEVWVDGDDHVRRISLAFDMGDLLAGIESVGPAPADLSMGFDMSMSFSDYGDESIEIEVPQASVDLTDTFVELSERGGGFGGPSAAGGIVSPSV